MTAIGGDPIAPAPPSLAGLRVAHVISTKVGFGGAEETLAQLIRGGAERGIEQIVLNPFALDAGAAEPVAFYAPARYEALECGGWRELPRLRSRLSRELRDWRPEIVHAHLHHAGALVASIGRRGWQTVFSHQHGDHFRQIGSRPGETIDRIATRRFDRVVGCSASVEGWLAANYAVAPDRICHVHNGWSGQPRPADPASSGPVIVCVARLRRQKNHIVLVEALALLRRRMPEARLMLVGDGPERDAITRRVGELELTGAVELVGTAADVWPLLAQARVFALASDYEPLGIAALEAMAAGLPVVATQVGGLTELVDADTGILVPRDDPAAMSAALERLIGDGQLAAAMGRAGAERAAGFHAERMVAGYHAVYAELLGRGDEPHA